MANQNPTPKKRLHLEDIVRQIESVQTAIQAGATGLAYNSESLANQLQAAAQAMNQFTGQQAELTRTELQAAVQLLHSDMQTDIDETRRIQQDAANQLSSATTRIENHINQRFDNTDSLIERWGNRILGAVGGEEFPVASIVMMFISLIAGIISGIAMGKAFAKITTKVIGENGEIIMKAGKAVETLKYEKLECVMIGICAGTLAAILIWLAYKAVVKIITPARDH